MDQQSRPTRAVWSDSEITTLGEDRLARQQFCSTVARLITDIPLEARSTVFGIVGPWGGGKTSILNMVRSEIEAHLESSGGSAPISVAEFNPWAMNDSTGLLLEFFETLLGSTETLKSPKNRDSLRELFRKCLPTFAAVPVVGQGVSKTLENFFGGRNWATEFANVDQIISAAGIRILIVVDDVDRLDADELKVLVKTIRMLGRFRNVHYLLAYDQSALIDVLRSALGGEPERAAAFLEKIVQYPLAIPPSQTHHLRIILNEGVARLFKQAGISPENAADNLFDRYLHRHLNTVRAVRRFCVQADLYFDLLQGEVDPADFLLVTYLRLFYPLLYSQLSFWKEEVTWKDNDEGSDWQAQMRNSPNFKSPDWAERLGEAGLVRSVDHLHVATLLTDLFHRKPPGMASLSSASYFERYFIFGIPEGDVSDERVRLDFERAITSSSGSLSVEDYRSTFTSASASTRLNAVNRIMSSPILLLPNVILAAVKFEVWLLGLDDVRWDQGHDRWLGRLLFELPEDEDSKEIREVLVGLPCSDPLIRALEVAEELTGEQRRFYGSRVQTFPKRSDVLEAIASLVANDLKVLSRSKKPTDIDKFGEIRSALAKHSLLDSTRAYVDKMIIGGEVKIAGIAGLFIGDLLVQDPSMNSPRPFRPDDLPLREVMSLISLSVLRAAPLEEESEMNPESARNHNDMDYRRHLAGLAIRGWKDELL